MGGVSKVLGSGFGIAGRLFGPALGLPSPNSILGIGKKKSSGSGGGQEDFIPGPDETTTPVTPVSPELPSNLNLRPPPTASDPSVAQARLRERRRAAATRGLRTILTSGAGLKTPASTAPRTLIGNGKFLPAFSSSSFNTLLGA